MINLACGVIRISDKCYCLEIFDQQESFKLDMIDLACGVIRISNNFLTLRYSINKVIQILPSCSDFHLSTLKLNSISCNILFIVIITSFENFEEILVLILKNFLYNLLKFS